MYVQNFAIFIIKYLLGCGGVFTTPTGTVMSPNYPNPYPPNVNCEWSITVEPQRNILFNFQDFAMEGNAETPQECRYDYTAVRAS